jgi:hypothetical protein
MPSGIYEYLSDKLAERQDSQPDSFVAFWAAHLASGFLSRTSINTFATNMQEGLI